MTDLSFDTKLDVVLGEYAVREFSVAAQDSDRRYDEVFGRFFGAAYTDGLPVADTSTPWSQRQRTVARSFLGIYSLEEFERGLNNRDPLLKRQISSDDMKLAIEGVQFLLPGQAVFGRVTSDLGTPLLAAGDDRYSLRQLASAATDGPHGTALVYVHDDTPPKLHVVPMNRTQLGEMEHALRARWGRVFADNAVAPTLGDYLGCELRRDLAFSLASRIIEPPERDLTQGLGSP